MLTISRQKVLLLAAACLSIFCTTRAAQAQIGWGNVTLSIDNADVYNGFPNATGAPVTLGTTLTGNVSVQGVTGNQGTTDVTCYDYLTGGGIDQIFSWSTQTDGGASFNWTPQVVGTHGLYCSADYSGQYVNGNATTAILSIAANQPSIQGYINPKYLVVGVTYAPPGPNSYVQYTSTAALSNTSSTSNTFGTGTTFTTSLKYGFGLPEAFHGSITATSSTSYTQSSTSSNSFTINQMSQRSYQVKGPNDPYAPVNHDYDIIWVWLNPVELYTVFPDSPNSVEWNGYGFDAADQPDLDIYPMQVGLLNGHLGPNPYGIQLSRSWATNQTFPPGEGPELTQTDINNILLADPYASSAYQFVLDPNSYPPTTTDGRFTLSSTAGGSTSNFVYVQPSAGGQPITQSMQNSYSTMSTAGQSTSNTSEQTFGIEANFAGGPFLQKFTLDLKTESKTTVTNQASSSVSSTTGQIDALSITGPPCNATTAPCVPVYNAPTEFDVYQDNIYGTFLFYPVR